MSRKSQRNRPTQHTQASAANQAADARRSNRRRVVIGSAVAVLLAVLAVVFLYKRDGAQVAATASSSPLASLHSPTLGNAAARVHIVEFLDPACETCALFYPLVKQLVADNPDRIRLSVRHIALHDGSDYVVRVLEASRRQDRYWQTLEALFATQAQWAPHHTVEPSLVRQAIAGLGLDVEQLMADMNSPEVSRNVEQDRSDAMGLKVTATPEYFVNGRPLPRFGEQELRRAVSEALEDAY
jgi:protein-disulfide isomerase